MKGYSPEELKTMASESYPFPKRQEMIQREYEEHRKKLGKEPESWEEFSERWNWVRAVFAGMLGEKETDELLSSKELEVLMRYRAEHPQESSK